MDRKDFFFKQRVTQAEVDAALAYVEQGLWNLEVDAATYGVIAGLVPSLGTAPNVAVTKGIAYDQLGRRIKAFSDGAGSKTESYATATDGTVTSVTGGNERWISIYANFGRQALDPRTDGNGATVYFDQPENLHDGTVGVLSTAGLGGAGLDKFLIVAGAAAATGTAVKPALLTTAILLCDIKRTPSDASNVLDTSRRQLLNVADTAAPGAGLAILMSAFSTWLGGRTNPAQATLHAQIDKIFTDLAATASSDDGAERVGAQASGNLPSGSVRSQLDHLDGAKPELGTSNHFTGAGNTQTLDGGLSVGGSAAITGNETVGGTLGVTGAATVGGTLGVTGGATVGGTLGVTGQETITPTLLTAALTTAQTADATRLLLMSFDFADSFIGAKKLRVYLNSKKLFTGGPRKSLLITHNCKWDGTNWNFDETSSSGFGDAFALELGGSRDSGASGTAYGTSGPIFYRMRWSGVGTTFADTDWRSICDWGYVFNSRATGSEGAIEAEGVWTQSPIDDGLGTNRFDVIKGQFVIGMANVDRFYAIGSRGYAGAAFTAGGVMNFPCPYSSAPSNVTVPTTDAVHTNCAAPTVVQSLPRGIEWATAVTGAGEYRLFNYITVRL